MSKPHKHSKEIKAWADGIAIQRRSFMTNHEWTDLEDGDEPCFMGSAEWRVKPEPPAKVYPVTGMSDLECAGAYIDGGVIAIANAALRHAIDSKQVITVGDHAAVMIEHGNACIRGATNAARDIAIAEAVRDACMGARYTIPGPDSVDLAVIVAGVKT